MIKENEKRRLMKALEQVSDSRLLVATLASASCVLHIGPVWFFLQPTGKTTSCVCLYRQLKLVNPAYAVGYAYWYSDGYDPLLELDDEPNTKLSVGDVIARDLTYILEDTRAAELGTFAINKEF